MGAEDRLVPVPRFQLTACGLFGGTHDPIFLFTAFGIGQFLSFSKRFRSCLHAVEVFGGALFSFVGALIFMNKLTWLSGKLWFLNRLSLQIIESRD
jgi:hypothetical protein